MTKTAAKRKQAILEEGERQDILEGLSRTRGELWEARAAFNMAIEPELVEACVYRINALYAQYAYYLRIAKEKNMAVSYGESLLGVQNIEKSARASALGA